MTDRRAAPLRLLLATTTLAAVLAACSGGAGTSVPPSAASSSDPGGPTAPPSLEVVGPITTPEAAFAAVVAAYPQFTGIGPKDPDLIGQSAWYEVMPASGVGAYLVTITVGWGDCQSGCIEQHTWTYAVLPDGAVTLQSESGGEVPPDAIPSGGSDAY